MLMTRPGAINTLNDLVELLLNRELARTGGPRCPGVRLPRQRPPNPCRQLVLTCSRSRPPGYFTVCDGEDIGSRSAAPRGDRPRLVDHALGGQRDRIGNVTP